MTVRGRNVRGGAAVAPGAAAAPDEAALHEAALRHISRYVTTQAGLIRVLDRRVARWARAAAPDPEVLVGLHAAARRIAARLTAAGAVDDAAFAAARSVRLARAGHSRRAIAAHLAAKGVDGALGRAALPRDDATELAAALTTLRRRRMGAFGPAPDAPTRQRQLAVLARAGFEQGLARRALAMAREEAETLLARTCGGGHPAEEQFD